MNILLDHGAIPNDCIRRLDFDDVKFDFSENILSRYELKRSLQNQYRIRIGEEPNVTIDQFREEKRNEVEKYGRKAKGLLRRWEEYYKDPTTEKPPTKTSAEWWEHLDKHFDWGLDDPASSPSGRIRYRPRFKFQ